MATPCSASGFEDEKKSAWSYDSLGEHASETDADSTPLFGARQRLHVPGMSSNGFTFAGLKTADGGSSYGNAFALSVRSATAPDTVSTASALTTQQQVDDVQAAIWNPISGSPSSGCLASGCILSYCFGSACVRSGCGGSACVGSGCGGSACGGSACGGSGCLGSACGGSGCLGSACGGSACLNCVEEISEEQQLANIVGGAGGTQVLPEWTPRADMGESLTLVAADAVGRELVALAG
ncbi:MAG: hypothetical protein AAFR38_08685 [Planctomycetota bacterium]